VQELHDQFLTSNGSSNVTKVSMLLQDVYADSDIPDKLPREMKFNP